MKYVVLAAGLSIGTDSWDRKDEFPANVKGFDYKDALERGLIAENEDGKHPSRKPKSANRSGIQGQVASGDASKAD